MTRRAEERHNVMLTWPQAACWDDRIHSAWCEDCGWSIANVTYYAAVGAALTHERTPEVPA